MNKILLVLLAAAVALSVSGCLGFSLVSVGIAMPAEAVVLGERSVTFAGDRDVVEVAPYYGYYRSLYVVVPNNDIEITSFEVTYVGGGRERFDTRMVFNHGIHSRYVPLRAGEQHIRSVAFTYRHIGPWNEKRARVEVYGVR